jgi:Zn-dependent peptidase ImmA (M78 family)
VRRVVAAMQLRHPELREPITLDGLLAVCERLDVPVYERGGTTLGMIVDMGGVAVIGVNRRLTGAARLFVILHELGHFTLHTRDDAIVERYQAERRALGRGRGAVWQLVEAEADRFAELVLGAELAAIAHAQLDATERAA